nr:NTP transferase domain-containing protein [Actinobaculum sp. 313]
MRLGGVSKPDVVVGGQRLLDLALAEVGRACIAVAQGGAQHDSAVVPVPKIVVVAPDGVALPPDVHRTLEDPPLGGPVAGLAAGLAELKEHVGVHRRAVVALLTCDAPLAPRLYPELLRQLSAHPRAAGAVPVSGEVVNRAASDMRERPDGRTFRQYLNGVYGAEELADTLRGDTRNSSARALFADLPVIEVPDTDNVSMDVDTWDDAADLEHRLAEG